MPHRPVNPLIKLANAMSDDIDKFAAGYDDAIDKKLFIRNIGDLYRMSENQKGMYANITTAVGITDDVYNDTFIYLFKNHSQQGGINRQGDSARIYAMADFIVQAYVDVSLHSDTVTSFPFSIKVSVYMQKRQIVALIFQHLDVMGDT